MMNTLFEYFIHFCTLRFLINVQIQEDLYNFMTENIFPVATAIYSSVGIILFRAFYYQIIGSDNQYVKYVVYEILLHSFQQFLYI